MRLAVTIAAVLAGVIAPAHAVSETAEGFSRAMQGCWNRLGLLGPEEMLTARSRNGVASLMCLKGGVEGVLTMSACHSHGDLAECSTLDGRYAFRDEKFWRSVDGIEDSCDVYLEPAEGMTLRNCVWVEPSVTVVPIEDASFERETLP